MNKYKLISYDGIELCSIDADYFRLEGNCILFYTIQHSDHILVAAASSNNTVTKE